MRRLWNDLLNEPVTVFTILSAGMVAANAEIESGWFNIATVVIVAIGGAVTRHYVKPTRKP